MREKRRRLRAVNVVAAVAALVILAAGEPTAAEIASCRKGTDCQAWSSTFGACPAGWSPSPDPCPAVTPTPLPTATPTAAPTIAPASWKWETLPARPAWATYLQNPSATIDDGGVAVWANVGSFHWPNVPGDHEETGFFRYPRAGAPRWVPILKSGRPGFPADASDTHECGAIDAVAVGDAVFAVFNRTTLKSIGCDANRVFGSLAIIDGGLDAARVSLRLDWLRPFRPDAGIRCTLTGSPDVGAARASATTVGLSPSAWQLLTGRPGGPPAPGLRARAAATSESCPWPCNEGNVAFENALIPRAGMVELFTYDSSAPGGPWVVYQIVAPWLAPTFLGAMTLPEGCRGRWGGWLEEVAIGLDGRLRALWIGGTDLPAGSVVCPTGAEIWPNVCEVRELIATDGFGFSWEWSGRSWRAPAGRSFVNASYVRDLRTGVAYPDALVVVLGNGLNPPDPASDWQLGIGYGPGAHVPLTDLRKRVP